MLAQRTGQDGDQQVVVRNDDMLLCQLPPHTDELAGVNFGGQRHRRGFSVACLHPLGDQRTDATERNRLDKIVGGTWGNLGN